MSETRSPLSSDSMSWRPLVASAAREVGPHRPMHGGTFAGHETLMDAEPAALDALESDLLSQTAQIVTQVRDQLADLTRREQSLAAQVSAFETDRRAFRLERQQFEAEAAETRARFEARQESWTAECDALRQHQANAAQQRADLERQQRALSDEQKLLREQAAEALADERQTLQSAVFAVNAEQEKLEQDRSDFERQRLALIADLHRQRQSLDFAFAVERQRLEEEINEAALSEQLRAERIRLNEERERLQQSIDDWYAQQAEAREAQSRQQEKVRLDQQRAEAEISQLRIAAEDEIERERLEHQRRLQADGRQLVEEQQRVEVEIRKQQALLESRTRFQQEHLDRSKAEIERAHDALRHEYQRSKQRLESLLETQRKQTRQLERRRAILDEYSDSLHRQQDSLCRLQSSLAATTENERQRLAADREAWELKVQTLAAENRRQSDMVSLHVENLDSRRAKLDLLRTELEQRHQDLLETRMAVDEAWAQLAQVTGDDQAAARVERARETLSDYYRTLRESLGAERTELDESRSLIESQKTQFRTDQQSFADWMAQREQQLRRQDEQLQTHLAQLSEQEHAWQRARDTWLAERLNAERIIRQLLGELSSSIDSAASAKPTDLPEMPNLLGLARFLDHVA